MHELHRLFDSSILKNMRLVIISRNNVLNKIVHYGDGMVAQWSVAPLSEPPWLCLGWKNQLSKARSMASWYR